MMDWVAGNHRFDAPTSISLVWFPQGCSVERVQVRVAAPALGQLGRARLALCLVHGPLLLARLAADHRRRALAGGPVDHLQDGKLRRRARRAAVDPQVVGELVQVSLGAGEQVTGRNRGAAGRLARGAGPPGAPGVLEAGQVGAERVGVGVAELRQQAEHVAAGAAQPLRKHARWNAEVVALVAEAVPFRLPGVRAELDVGGAQVQADHVAQPWRVDLRRASLAAVPDPVPVVEPGWHDRELGQVHDGPGAVGVEQRGRAARPDLGAVVLDRLRVFLVRVAERVDRLGGVVQKIC